MDIKFVSFMVKLKMKTGSKDFKVLLILIFNYISSIVLLCYCILCSTDGGCVHVGCVHPGVY